MILYGLTTNVEENDALGHNRDFRINALNVLF